MSILQIRVRYNKDNAMSLFIDRVHRLPRIWSNRELQKFAHLFHGDIVNVSAWKDIDKEGGRYRDYFVNASSYTMTNFKAEARGFQGYQDEIFLDLEKELPRELNQRFDVVFNHTTLEHIYDVKTAFSNLCRLSKDCVILVLPFLQQYHTDYGDYWRFTPLAIKKMFEENGCELLYQRFNSDKMSSVYVISIASKYPDKWRDNFKWSFSCTEPKGRKTELDIGCRALPNMGYRCRRFLDRIYKSVKEKTRVL